MSYQVWHFFPSKNTYKGATTLFPKFFFFKQTFKYIFRENDCPFHKYSGDIWEKISGKMFAFVHQ